VYDEELELFYIQYNGIVCKLNSLNPLNANQDHKVVDISNYFTTNQTNGTRNQVFGIMPINVSGTISAEAVPKAKQFSHRLIDPRRVQLPT
jgi:hypothetical protein